MKALIILLAYLLAHVTTAQQIGAGGFFSYPSADYQRAYHLTDGAAWNVTYATGGQLAGCALVGVAHHNIADSASMRVPYALAGISGGHKWAQHEVSASIRGGLVAGSLGWAAGIRYAVPLSERINFTLSADHFFREYTFTNYSMGMEVKLGRKTSL